MGPMKELAELFMDAFRHHAPILQSIDYIDGRITLVFMHRHVPTSDMIRDIVFKLYLQIWGEKPDWLECVYKESNGYTGSAFASQAGNKPIIMDITAKMETYRKMMKTLTRHVLDRREFEAWLAELPPRYWASSHDRIVSEEKFGHLRLEVAENAKRGKITDLRISLFKRP